MSGSLPVLWEHLKVVLSGWTGIALAIIAVVGLIERAIDRRFTIANRNKVILAVVVLFIAQFRAYKMQHDEIVRLTSRDGLIPLFEEGQKMWPDCLTLAQSTIDEWSKRVEADLRSRRDGAARVARFYDDSGIPPRFPEAAMKGYTSEEAHKCFRLNARLVRLNQFLSEPDGGTR